ncbi:HNH endonuclease [Candidatus Omnitrophota bacterium]
MKSKEHFDQELNNPETNYFIFDTKGGGKHGDIDFFKYEWSRSRYNLVKKGDLFIYRRPDNASETKEFYFFGACRIGKIVGDDRVSAKLEQIFPFHNRIYKKELEHFSWKWKARGLTWEHFFNQYGMNKITKEDFVNLIALSEKGLPGKVENELAQQFHYETIKIYEKGKELFGYNAVRFLQKIRKDGGLQAAKAWLNPEKKNKLPTAGFLKLVANGRLDISLEATVLREPWIHLFEAEELSVARNRLRDYGYNGVELENQESKQLIPEEILESQAYTEGAKRTITVNAYERNPKARQQCIAHYGCSCSVCGFSFGKSYGDKFQDFIHVHHLRPLATIAEEYKLDPIRDLIPVCPNCHAVIHRKDPPYTINEIITMQKDSD